MNSLAVSKVGLPMGMVSMPMYPMGTLSVTRVHSDGNENGNTLGAYLNWHDTKFSWMCAKSLPV